MLRYLINSVYNSLLSLMKFFFSRTNQLNTHPFQIAVIFLCLLTGFSCSRKSAFINTIYPEANQRNIPTEFSNTSKPCNDKLAHIPQMEYLDHTPIKYIRLNFHIMRKSDGSGNFSEEQGRWYVKELLRLANGKLENNGKMNLPINNNTAVLPMRYRYVLTPRPNDPNDDGIYFHDDDELCALIGDMGNKNGKRLKNNYKRDVYRKYGVQKDTVLNVFVMAYPPKHLREKTFISRGIAFMNWVKITTAYEDIKRWKNNPANINNEMWMATRNLHHEIGHCFGLRHSWAGNDGCDDTPHHPNCWNKHLKNEAGCEGINSNNVMDYNTSRSAWSPCQIGTCHYTMSRKNSKMRPLLVPTWCEFKETSMIRIYDDVEWAGAKDIEGHLVIQNGGSLTIRCRLSIPPNGKIVVHPKGKLILDGAELENDCGKKWEGIEVLSVGGQKGEVVYLNTPIIRDVKNKIAIKSVSP